MEKLALYFAISLVVDFIVSGDGRYEPDWAAIVASVLISFGLEAILLGE